MSLHDYRSERLSKNEARKLISKIIARHPGNVRFSGHAIKELSSDGLTTTDALNVLKSSDARIHQDGELESGSFRYRMETTNFVVVVAFSIEGNSLNVVTAWDKRKGR